MKKYRSKPVEPHEVEAFQWDGNADTANRLIGDRYGKDWEYLDSKGKEILIRPADLGLTQIAHVGDWITYQPLCGFTAYTPEQFAQAYEDA